MSYLKDNRHLQNTGYRPATFFTSDDMDSVLRYAQSFTYSSYNCDFAEKLQSNINHQTVSWHAWERFLGKNKGYTILHQACWDGELEIILTLLRHPTININIKTGTGQTPFMHLLTRYSYIKNNDSIERTKSAILAFIQSGKLDINLHITEIGKELEYYVQYNKFLMQIYDTLREHSKVYQ